MYEYNALIEDVYDGDTATALVDLGMRVCTVAKLRLYGIDTPEIRGESRLDGLQARLFLAQKILGKRVIIKTHKDKTEKFGRWLAEIYLPGEEKSVNQQLLDAGLAVPFD